MQGDSHYRKRMRDELADREALRTKQTRNLTDEEVRLLDEWIRDPQGHARALRMLSLFEKAVIG